MNKKYICLPALVVAFILGQPAFGTPKAPTATQHVTHDHHERLGEMFNKLNLSDEQKIKVNAIKTKMLDQLQERKKQMISIQMEIGGLIHSDAMDDKKLDELIAKETQLLSTMMKNTAVIRHQMFNILNPEQKATLLEMSKKWMEKHQQEEM